MDPDLVHVKLDSNRFVSGLPGSVSWLDVELVNVAIKPLRKRCHKPAGHNTNLVSGTYAPLQWGQTKCKFYDQCHANILAPTGTEFAVKR